MNRKSITYYLRAFIGSFLGIATIAVVNTYLVVSHEISSIFLTGAFGATAVLVFAEVGSPLAQPKNVFIGHLFSAFIGVVFYKLFAGQVWLASALAVSVAIVGMKLLEAQHPPGGATALIAVIGGKEIYDLGFLYILTPVFINVILLLSIAYISNNLIEPGCYPYKKQP